MTGNDSRTAVAVFARAPIAGQAKTRLIPRLGAAGSAALQNRMIERSAKTAVEAGIGPVSVWCSPDCNHQVFQSLAATNRITLQRQEGHDLGARMQDAFERLPLPALLMGTDCPVLEPEHLRRAAAALRNGYGAVFYPAEDGGYVLIGLRAVHTALFDDIPWGTADVMAITRERLRSIAVNALDLDTLWDVDRPEDYDRMIAQRLL